MASGKRIVIAGGSGFIGMELGRRLSKRGDEVVILTRKPGAVAAPMRGVYWDGKTVGEWAKEIDGAYAVVNLAGKNVNCRYTKAALHEIDQGRVDAVEAMAQAVNGVFVKPRVLIQASTTAIYGHTFDKWCDESQPPGFETPGSAVPVATATQWERAYNEHATPGVRRVLLRISFVLGATGGALSVLTGLTRWFLGGAVGSGKQYISWLHIEDMCRVVEEAIESDMEGLYNVATPHAVTNGQFMREMRRVLRRPWCPPTPAFLVRLGCFLLRTEPVLALTGRRAMPRRLLERGFVFRYPELPGALKAVFGGTS